MKNITFIVWDNIKTLFFALVIALIIRSLFFQPFYIPSSSMEPTLLIGDRIFVSKYSYGYSKHSFPFSPSNYKKRIFKTDPKQGDLIVFKTPADNRTDYIKRLIGLPGDQIKFTNGNIFINGKEITKKKIDNKFEIRCGVSNFNVYRETGSMQNSDLYTVPNDHYFFLGDNRDCSKDSRYLSSVGYVKNLNLVGKAQLVFFSNDTVKGSILKIWNLHNSLRIKRFFKKL